MKDLSILQKLVRPEAKSAITKQFGVSPKTIEFVLRGKEENQPVLCALVREAGVVLDQLVANYAALAKQCQGETQEPSVRVADPIHEDQQTAASFAQPASDGLSDAVSVTKENPNPSRPVVIRSRSWEERERLAKVIASLSPYQFEFIKRQNGTYSTAYDHDHDLLAACFTLHQQGYSKNGLVIFMKQNALSVFDQEVAYATLQRLQGDYINHIRLDK
jgi:hypothetical protein